MNKMNNKKEKTMFSVEMCEDDSGMFVKARGNQLAVGMVAAIGLVQYFDQEDTVLNMEDFIPVLEKACEDSEFLEMMVHAASLYAKDEDDGLIGFAALVAAANIERLTGGKNKEEDEKGGPVA